MRLCAAPERKTSREFRMSAEFSFFVFSTMYGDKEYIDKHFSDLEDAYNVAIKIMKGV